MANEADRFWNSIVKGLRRYMRLSPPSDKEAELELNAADEIPISEEKIESIVQSVTSGNIAAREAEPMGNWSDEADVEDVEKEMELVLNRNEGEADSDVDELIERLRREALEDKGSGNGARGKGQGKEEGADAKD